MRNFLFKKLVMATFSLLIVLVALAGGFFAFNAYIYEQKQPDAAPGEGGLHRL